MFSLQSIYALILSLVAGLSTLIGTLPIYKKNINYKKIISISLGFAGGVMLSISLVELFPLAINELLKTNNRQQSVLLSTLFLGCGVFVAHLIDKFVPHEKYDCEESSKENHQHVDLFKIGFVSMIALTIHNFPEGIATFVSGYENLSLGISVTIAIALHNIPEGISIAVPIFYATKSKKKAFLYTFIASISEPIGALISLFFIGPNISTFFMGSIFSLIAGVMTYVAIEELLPSSRQYGYCPHATIATLVGILIMPLTMIF